MLCHCVSDDAAGRIGAATGSERDDDYHGSVWVGLGLRLRLQRSHGKQY